MQHQIVFYDNSFLKDTVKTHYQKKKKLLTIEANQKTEEVAARKHK